MTTLNPACFLALCVFAAGVSARAQTDDQPKPTSTGRSASGLVHHSVVRHISEGVPPGLPDGAIVVLVDTRVRRAGDPADWEPSAPSANSCMMGVASQSIRPDQLTNLQKNIT